MIVINLDENNLEEWQVVHLDEVVVNGYEMRVCRVTVFHAGFLWTMNLDLALFKELKACVRNSPILDNLERYAMNEQKRVRRIYRQDKRERNRRTFPPLTMGQANSTHDQLALESLVIKTVRKVMSE